MALWTPTLITTAHWLDASDSSTVTLNGSTVSQWADKSGSGKHATQGTAASQPTRLAADQNGLDVLSFDGIANRMDHSFVASTAEISIFLVVAANSQSGYRGIYSTSGDNTSNTMLLARTDTANWGTYGTTAQSANSSIQSAGFLQLALIRIAAGSGIFWRNGASDGSFIASSGQPGHVGGTSSIPQHFGGKIAEIVVLSGTVSTESRQLLEGYLAWKWGLVGNLAADHPYKSAAPTTANKVSGTVTVNGSPAARTVAVFLRSNFTLLGTTTSDASTGAFEIIGVPSDANALLVTAIDSTDTYNAVSVDYITSVSS